MRSGVQLFALSREAAASLTACREQAHKASLSAPDLRKLGKKKVHVPYMYPNMVDITIID